MRIIIYLACFLIVTLLVSSTENPSSPGPTPPTAKKIHTENLIHGGKLVDDYHWLREKSNPDVARYLEAENAYADSIMKSTEPLQKKLNTSGEIFVTFVPKSLLSVWIR